MAQILVVDDEVGIRELLSEILSDEGHSVQLAENATAARSLRAQGRPDLVLLDIWMPDADGITLLKEWATGGQLTMPVIMMSGHGTIDTAVEATRIGAMDFLEKPIALQKLLATVKRALRAGEARALNDASQDLLQQAAGGVLFVEELAALSKNQQKHLAFFTARAEKINMRLVSFTAEEPKRLVESQGFDPALMQGLAGIVIALPALREHPEDIPEIASLMLAQLVETRFCPPRNFSTGALNVLRYFSWPGNLEDLAAAVRTLALTSLEEEIGAGDAERVVPQFARRAADVGVSLDLPLREAREAFERNYFEHHLAQANGSIARVAERSGLERTHLYRKLKALGIFTGRKED